MDIKKYIISSVSSAIITKTLIAPLERIKMLQQVQSYYNMQNYNGLIQSLKYIKQNEGFYGYYKGNLTNIFRYKLLKRGIATGVHYHMCIHEQPAYRKILPYKRNDFPIAEKIAKEMVSLPIWPYMTKKQLNKICESIRKIG